MSGWGKGQFKMFAKDIKEAYPGKAWSLVAEELREAVLCEKVLGVVLGQDRESVVIDDIQALYNGIKEEMGQMAVWINDEHKDESMKLHAERKAKKESKSVLASITPDRNAPGANDLCGKCGRERWMHGTRHDTCSRFVEEGKAEWNGMCPAGKHGLDRPGQDCDLCVKEVAS